MNARKIAVEAARDIAKVAHELGFTVIPVIATSIEKHIQPLAKSNAELFDALRMVKQSGIYGGDSGMIDTALRNAAKLQTGGVT